MIKQIGSQLKLVMRKKGIYVSFFFMTVLTTLSLLKSGTDLMKKNISVIPCLVEQTINNTNNIYWNIFVYALPFLAALPFSFCALEEKQKGLSYYVTVRMSKKKDMIAKTIVSFFIPFALCLVILLMNYLACALIFPYNQNYFGSDLYDDITMAYIKGDTVMVPAGYVGVFLKQIFLRNPIGYNLVLFFIIACYAGFIGGIDHLCSYLIGNNKILVFLPGYLLFMLGKRCVIFLEREHIYVNTDITSYMSLNIQYGRGLPVLIGIFGVLVLLTLILFGVAVRKEKKSV